MYLITYSNIMIICDNVDCIILIINKVDYNMYINIVLILCMIKVRVITLGKLIGLLFLF